MDVSGIDSLVDYTEGRAEEGSFYRSGTFRVGEAQLVVNDFEEGYNCQWESDVEVQDLVSVMEPWCRLDSYVEAMQPDGGCRRNKLGGGDFHIGLYDLSDFSRVELNSPSFSVYWTELCDMLQEPDYLMGKNVEVAVENPPERTDEPFIEPVRRIHQRTIGEDIPTESSKDLVTDAEEFLTRAD